ncbi:TPA: DUF1310 family protein [Streptococcus equi subsp. zooepidemicus]|uniref:DUF1310 family protein n=1 Tax=Streptococcus equi TaxID=1336 RepID=UPI0018CB2248|nr:DUF1310 family protein [Streptococcus equi]MCD3397564.1 DUF1310 domain-containing protein [Streptococcus equi subsp. zooepidemicus]MCD3415268.1 DUF1310 domain-containing protein [Streptococcus equi subsp. zooepidemicus]MCD3426782.1 DUF1310 domain-containing protein [Streptococcus equi subsp. zooepidemicus]QTC13275.1 hypothetical protein HIEAAJJG_02071 [Streptococcus equi subsp. zooepidemicus]HEL0015332.1 DUF1310 family protein [Streptococcus equi subsp. zooepidemicus]
MNRFLKISLLIVGVIVIMLGMEVKHRMDIYDQIKQEEIKIAQSKEAIVIYEQELKWLDPNALTNEGTIKSYSIDLDSITLNPMGGFSIHLIINDDPDIYLRVGLGRYDLEGNLEIASNYRSEKLEKLLKGVER